MTGEERSMIAATLNALKPTGEHATVGERVVWRRVVLGLAELLPESERDSFVDDCGVRHDSIRG
jgi:hypothetical protein